MRTNLALAFQWRPKGEEHRVCHRINVAHSDRRQLEEDVSRLKREKARLTKETREGRDNSAGKQSFNYRWMGQKGDHDQF